MFLHHGHSLLTPEHDVPPVPKLQKQCCLAVAAALIKCSGIVQVFERSSCTATVRRAYRAPHTPSPEMIVDEVF